MLPPELDSIAETARTLFREWLRRDDRAVELSDLQMVEEEVTAFVLELGRGLIQDFADERWTQAMASREMCSCGRLLTPHRHSRWTRQTLLGPVTVPDFYVYCRECGDGDRPLHAWLGTDRETWSLPAQEAAVDLVADESCQKAVDKLERHHPGVVMGRTTALRLLHAHGEKARSFIDAKLASAGAAAIGEAQQADGVAELEVEFDGGMVPVATLHAIDLEEGEEPELTPVRKLPKRRKECGWEEAKVGLVQVPGETTRLYSLRPTGELDAAFDDLLGLACMKGWSEQTRVRGIADGARHIRPRLEETFHACDFRFILDRPHCKEHLSSAGEALEPATGVPAQEWAGDALARMEVGAAHEVVMELREAHREHEHDVLRREANYFERNGDAVAYAEYREQGWSTASSEVESAHGHIVQPRLKVSGAWWHPNNVDNVLALRMLKANGWWEEYWVAQRQQWSERAASFARRLPARAA